MIGAGVGASAAAHAAGGNSPNHASGQDHAAAEFEDRPSRSPKKNIEPYGLPGQEPVGKFYNGNVIQVCVAGIIGANFLTNIIEKQIDPSGTQYSDGFAAFDLFYNIVFTIELGVNMYAHWWRPFFDSGWNWFDLTVVTIGIVNMLKLPLPKAFSLLRMMRAFRVFRLFKRVKSLNKIIVAIVHAVPGVVNAFLILTIVMCIYAILAVEFYKDVGRGCESQPFRKGFDTKRDFCFGNEYFGTFSKSIYTFFQVLTGESWSENVARPVIWFYEDQILSTGSALFFVSFVIVTGMVLTNVVVAVLLDKMTSEAEVPVEEIEEAEEAPPPPALSEGDTKMARQLGRIQGTLGELGSSAVDLQKDFDTVKVDMVEMRDQIAVLVKAVERKYRLACL